MKWENRMLQNSDLFLNAVEKDSLDLAFQSSGIDQCVYGNMYFSPGMSCMDLRRWRSRLM